MESDNSRIKRLAGVLERYSEDDQVVAALAKQLNYDPETLKQDMRAMEHAIAKEA